MATEFDANAGGGVPSLIDKLLSLPEADRAAWLDALRTSNPQEHAGLMKGLVANAAALKSVFLGSEVGEAGDAQVDGGDTRAVADQPTLAHESAMASARQIGPYRLLQKLGEGGMGEVWLAEQTAPVRRQVAIKVIKQGMDTRQVVARFEAERQALALMDHPCVAKVFEAGSTSEGRPYFAMEYVKGIPITDYCDRNRLNTRARLELFVSLCEGVQHAHQKAIIHRDLKPSNVLVVEQDGRRLPKVIDFGVAKAVAQRLTEKTMFTELGVLIGTPEYMSPEQADLTGENVDTRTDVYSLGVILYELLVGALPFDSKELRSGGFEGIRRMIREGEPKRPSTRFATLRDVAGDSATHRRTDPATLLRLLKGDLDWITMKALEKDRARRYGSPADLAADIARHLGDEAVQARPPSTGYRAKKFVRRHRWGVATAAGVTVALLTAIVGTSLGLVRATRAEGAARAEQARAEKVAKFLSDVLGDLDPIGMGKTVRAEILDQLAAYRERGGPSSAPPGVPSASLLDVVNTVDVARHLVDDQILRKAVTRIESELREDPALAARLYETISSAEYSLQLYDRSRVILVRAIELSTRAYGAEALLTLDLQVSLGYTNLRAGNYAEAEATLRQVVATSRRALGENARLTLFAMNHLGDTYRYEGRPLEAEPLLRETLDKMRRTFGDDDSITIDVGNNLALALKDERRYDEADTLLRDSVSRMTRLFPGNEGTIRMQSNRAMVLRLAGRLEEAERLLLDAREAAERAFGNDAYMTLRVRFGLGDVYVAQRRFPEAEVLMRDTVDRMRRNLGREHPETFSQIYSLAGMLLAQGRVNEAEPLFLEVVPGFKRVYGARHVKTFGASNDLASLYEKRGRWAEAERLLRDTAEALDASHPIPLDAVYAHATFHLACLASHRGRRSDAMAWLGKSVDTGLTPAERITSSVELMPLRGPELDVLVTRAQKH